MSREPAFDRPETALPPEGLSAVQLEIIEKCKETVLKAMKTKADIYERYSTEFYKELMKPDQGKLYIIGALKNRSIIDLGIKIRELGYDVFDDWISPGPEADEQWQEYERIRGRGYKEALYSHHADTVFNYDLKHLTEADTVVMVMPCGKSGHLEFGWAIGQGKTGYILFEGEPDRYDVMYRFATDVFMSEADLLERLGD